MIDQEFGRVEAKVFPNPTIQDVTLLLQEEKLHGYTYKLADISGHVLDSKQL